MNHSVHWTSQMNKDSTGVINALDTLSPPSDPYDIILETNDGSKFLAHRAVLRLASSAPEVLFGQPEDPMVALPGPMRPMTPFFGHSRGPSHQCLPTYRIDADKDTLANLLRLLYPITRTPSFLFLPIANPKTFDIFGPGRRPVDLLITISPVLALAQKLHMPGIIADLCLGILQIANVPGAIEDYQVRYCSLTVYEIACHLWLPDIAQAAAYVWLTVPIEGTKLGIEERSSIGYNASSEIIPPVLIEFRSQAVAAALSIFNLSLDGLQLDAEARLSHLEKAVLENITCEMCYNHNVPPFSHAGRNNTVLHIAAWWSYFKQLAYIYLRTVPRCERLLSYRVVSAVAKVALDCNVCCKTFLINWQKVQSVIWLKNTAALDLVKLNVHLTF